MVDVEHRALRAFEEHALAGRERLVKVARGVGHVRTQQHGGTLELRGNGVEVEHGLVEDVPEIGVLLFEHDAETLAKVRFVEQIGHAEPDARRLVFVRGADAAAGRSDLALAASTLARLIDGLVVGQNEVTILTHEQPARA